MGPARSTNGTASPGPRRSCSWVSCWSSPSRPAGPCDLAMAPPADARLQLEAVRLTALYGRRAVVKDVSILFPAHTVTAVIGPSGCGKSTFLRCLNRMHELSEGGWVTGRVLLDGADVRSEEHTSELQSLTNLVCRLLLEKKKKTNELTSNESG